MAWNCWRGWDCRGPDRHDVERRGRRSQVGRGMECGGMLRSVEAGWDRHVWVVQDEARQERSVKTARSKLMQGELRSGRKGKSGLSSGRMTRRVGARQAAKGADS